MDKIIHPETGEKYNIFSSKGIEILDKYMHTYSVGGNPSIGDTLNNSITYLSEKLHNLQDEFTSLLHNQTGGAFTSPIKGLLPSISSSDDETLFGKRSSDSEDIPISLYSTAEELALNDYNARMKATSSVLPYDVGFLPIPPPKPNFPDIVSKSPGVYPIEDGKIMKVYNDLLEYNESKNLYENMEGYPELSERYVKPIKWDFKTLSCEMEKVGESISNRLTLKKPLEGEGSEMFYLDDYFDSVVLWLKETLELLHSKDLYHGDILGEGNFHIGNIVCELDDGIWKYKLIDFGDKLGETENSYITFGVDSNREVREMSGKQKEEILLRKLFTDEGKYTVELNFFKNKIEMEEKRRKNRNNKTLLYTGKRGRDDDVEIGRYSKKRNVPPLPMMIDYEDEDAVAAPSTPTRSRFRPLRLTPSPSPTQSFGTRLQFTPSPGTNRTLFTTPPPLPSPGLARTLFTTSPSPSISGPARTPPPPSRST